MSAVPIVCFGEILWDLLPHGCCLGGAPLNVVHHLNQQGVAAVPCSAVGDDELGSEALRSIARSGVSFRGVSTHLTLETGVAEVSLNETGQATYRFPEPCAWDAIRMPTFGFLPTTLVFGTLALRRGNNRIRLREMIGFWKPARVVCDLNLRPPYDDIVEIETILQLAHVIKLNDEEATKLCSDVPSGDLRRMAQTLQKRFKVETVCITAGGDGAVMAVGDRWFEQPAIPVEVCDTVGAGDAFTAGLLAAWHHDPDDHQAALAVAAGLAAHVASQPGAQPPPVDQVKAG